MLYCYGENSFTFLLFTAVASKPELATVLLANLKRFSNGRRLSESNGLHSKLCDDPQPDVWLFPNFGKGKGFGEPDAIVLCGGFSFWFEVETRFDLIKRRANARTSLRQLLRFHYFAQALSCGNSRRNAGNPHWAIMGPTIRGNGNARDGVLRVAKHSFLNEGQARKKLVESIKAGRDHYVILSYRRIGRGRGNEGTGQMKDFFCEVNNESHQTVRDFCEGREVPQKAKINRFWYQYYEHDLKGKNVEIGDDLTKYIGVSS